MMPSRSSLIEGLGRGNLALAAGEDEFVAVWVFEFGHGAPDLLLRLFCQFHAFGFEQGCRGEDVVAPEGHWLKATDSALVAGRGEEGETYFGAGDEELDPALAGAHGLVGCYFESHLFCVELERDILVADGDADELDSANHVEPPG